MTLSVNGLNTSVKRLKIAKWTNKQDSTVWRLKEAHFKRRNIGGLQVKGWKIYVPGKSWFEKLQVANIRSLLLAPFISWTLNISVSYHQVLRLLFWYTVITWTNSASYLSWNIIHMLKEPKFIAHSTITHQLPILGLKVEFLVLSNVLKVSSIHLLPRKKLS